VLAIQVIKLVRTLKNNSVRTGPATFDADDQRLLASSSCNGSHRISNPRAQARGYALEAPNFEVNVANLKTNYLSWKALILIHSKEQVPACSVRK
jgi:hypothetical protein